MANIASVTVKTRGIEVVVMAHNRQPITDQDWESSYLTALRKMRASAPRDRMANLCFADGPGPNAKQRAAGNAIFNEKDGYRLRVAVVTDSILVRGAVTTLSWFNPLIKAYSPHQWELGFGHVLFTPADYPEVLAALQTLRSKVSDAPPLNDVIDRMTGANRSRDSIAV